jgi:phenylalanyl-tRNA synthetase beta chain
MKTPLSWLRAYVDVPETPEVLAEQLPMLGLGVESVEPAAGGNDDAVFDFEIASNRPDLLSLIGIAREMAAWRRRDVRLPDDALDEHDPPASMLTSVQIIDPDLCPRYVAHVITGVTVRPSPAWLTTRLEAAGVRPINNIVDATNYVMLEWGQPQHAFDLDTLTERRIVVRPAAAGETLVTLDGVTRELDPQTLVIADARRPVALAGIMGGAETEIGAGTRNVLLEAASFAPASVRRSSRRLGLRTEASARFERGLDRELAGRASRRCAKLIAELSGGRVHRGGVDAYPRPLSRPTITLRLPRLRRVLGMTVPPADAETILTRLGVELHRDGDALRATPPIGRRDLEREEDLIEEVVRHYGYERIPEALPVEALHQGRRATRLETEASARDALIRAGLTEAFTISLISPRLLERLGLDHDDPWRDPVPLRNPLTSDHTHLRPCLLPGLLEAVRVNASHRREAVHFFDIGRVFSRRTGGGVDERRALALALRGRWVTGDWRHDAVDREVTFFHMRGVLETLFAELRTGPPVIRPARRAWLHPSRAGEVVFRGEVIGAAGELHPDVAARFDLPGRTVVAEMTLAGVLEHAVTQPRFSGFPRFPAVRRDVAVVAADGLPQADVESAICEIAGTLLESVELFDVYAGPPLAEGRRNLAYTLIFRAHDRTLAGDEVDEIIRKIHEALPERLPVTIRL